MIREVSRKDLAQPIVKGQAQRETCKSSGNWKVRVRGEVSFQHFVMVLVITDGLGMRRAGEHRRLYPMMR